MAKLVAQLLATAALWVRIQTSLKIQNGQHKQRSGQHIQGCGSGSALIWVAGSESGCWVRNRIRIQEGKNYLQVWKKRKEFSCFEVLDVIFWRLKASPEACASFLGCKFFSIFVHPFGTGCGSESVSISAIRKNAGTWSGSALNQCGSTTLTTVKQNIQKNISLPDGVFSPLCSSFL